MTSISNGKERDDNEELKGTITTIKVLSIQLIQQHDFFSLAHCFAVVTTDPTDSQMCEIGGFLLVVIFFRYITTFKGNI